MHRDNDIPAGSTPAAPALASADAAGSNEIAEILRLGDRLLNRTFPIARQQPLTPPLLNGRLLSRVIRQWTPEAGWQAAVKWLGAGAALAAVDLPHMLLRLPHTGVMLTLDALERRFHARELVCPYCFSPQSERYVYCHACERVQSSLRPAFGEFWSRRCECGRARFRLLGNYKSPPPGNLVCRRSTSFSGCMRPLPPDVPWGRYPEIHVALAGPTKKKLMVLDRLWSGLAAGKDPQWRGKPCWELTQREFAYLSSTLDNGSEPQEGPRGRLGYTLARSGIFHVRNGPSDRLLQFHNIAGASLRSDSILAMQSMHLVHDDVLVLVLDLDYVDTKHPGLSPHAPIYTKLLRCAERLRGEIRAVDFWPRVAVVVPVEGRGEEIDSKKLSDTIRAHDPHLWGLLHYTVGDKVSYFGGPLRERAASYVWVRRLLDYILGPHDKGRGK